MLDTAVSRFKSIAPAVDFYSIRIVDENQQSVSVRQNIVQPVNNQYSLGVHITVCDRGGIGYAATSDLSIAGMKLALDRAINWAHDSADLSLIPGDYIARPQIRVKSASSIALPWTSTPLTDKLEMLQKVNQRLNSDDRIIDWWASLYYGHFDSVFVTPDAEIFQSFATLMPYLGAVANQGTQTQKRTFGIDCSARGGMEILVRVGFDEQAERVADEALALLAAPDCPSEHLDLLLMPNQMVLQIHESIGHPLELDRILGDERNYAGTSFVNLSMFGEYQYGSNLLNVSFDPEYEFQIASYGFDDDGSAATREYLIKNGILMRPLGGYTSQRRADTAGVACSRASGWNRPPIDRMANINLEPGNTPLNDMIGSVENGILMDTNRSWSIDDSRNKFQFGCELGRRIKNGKLKELVKNPNYRGISSRFWRSLKTVGDPKSFEVLSVPACGKGEPNQAVQVGHASPACLFDRVDVFGVD